MNTKAPATRTRRSITIAAAVLAVVMLSGCAEETLSGPRNLLPDLEARTRYGFTVDEAKNALESLNTVVTDALEAGDKFADLDFDRLNELSPEIAILPGAMDVSTLGGAATVAAIANDGKTILGASYGDSGYCVYMRITNGTPLKVERGIGFQLDCNAAKPASSITWSSTGAFPETSQVTMPEGTFTKGDPVGQPSTTPSAAPSVAPSVAPSTNTGAPAPSSSSGS